MTARRGQAVVHHSFHGWRPVGGELPGRAAGVMMATEGGRATPYALDMLDDRGFFFIEPGDQVYEGQVVGEHNRENDIVVNVVRAKKLTNYRAVGKDEAAKVRPYRDLSLEDCLEYIETDELVEVTPNAIRMRKRTLSASARKRESRQK